MTATLATVIAALLIIETGGHPSPDTAVGDNGRAVGCLQIWPCMVREANRVEAIRARKEGRPARVWSLADRTDRARSIEMAEAVLGFHYRRGVTDPVLLACKWNTPYGKIREVYRNKVRKHIKGGR